MTTYAMDDSAEKACSSKKGLFKALLSIVIAAILIDWRKVLLPELLMNPGGLKRAITMPSTHRK